MTVTRRQVSPVRYRRAAVRSDSSWSPERACRDRPIVVAGAGSIGCFVGGLLAGADRRVSLLARPRVITEIERFGLTLTSLEGSSWHMAFQQLKLSEDSNVLAEASVVLVTVKSADTAEIADAIALSARRMPSSSSCRTVSPTWRCLREPIAGEAGARGHGAVQCDRGGRRAISSRHLRRYRDRA